MISYKAKVNCMNLNHFIQPTSRASYQDLINSGELNTQLKQLVKIYGEHDEGLTDVQASRILNVDASTLSARRNDLTKKYGSHIIVNVGTRNNGTGRRSGIVWKLNNNRIKE